MAQAFQIALEGDVTIRTIASVHQRLRDALRDHATVAVDCRDLTHVDITLIQCLLAARVSAREHGRQLVLVGPPGAPLEDALRRGGFLSAPEVLAGDISFWNEGGRDEQ